jgi:hypothetical protein
MFCINRNGRRHRVYRVIQKEMLISWEVTVLVSVKKNSYMHVSNSERKETELFESTN